MNSSISASMGIKEWSMLIVLSVLWGGSFFLVELAVAELPPLTIVLVRVALAAVTLWLFIIIKGLSVPRSLSVWGSFLIMGLSGNVLPFSLIVWGQTYIASGLASILNATTPLFTVIVASILLQDEKITKRRLVGVIFGFFGTVVMLGSSASDGNNINIVAQLAVLGAAVSYAFAGVYGRRFKAQNINPVITAAGQVSASAIVLFPITLVVDGITSIAIPSIQIVISLVALAVFSTAVAFVLAFKILASAGATNLSLVTFLVPVSAILLGILVLGETLKVSHAIGMGTITIGLVAIDGRLWSDVKSTH